MKRATWLDLFGASAGPRQALPAKAREALSRLDDALFDIWNLGENVLLAWNHDEPRQRDSRRTQVAGCGPVRSGVPGIRL